MKKLIVFMFSVVLLGSCQKDIEGCTDPQAKNYNADATKDDGSCEFIGIGDTMQGGIIFFLDGNGGGLIAAPTDQGQAEWGCYANLTLINDTAIGAGAQNTINIVDANCSPLTTGNSIAAKMCDSLVLGGYSDWFLPSKNELNLMWTNLADSDGNGVNTGESDPNNLGGFVNSYYWSSSEGTSTNSWAQAFDFGNQSLYGKSASLNVVRAVRSF